MDVVRTVENGVNEISLSELLFQYIVQRIREKEFIDRCTIVKRNIVTAVAELYKAMDVTQAEELLQKVMVYANLEGRALEDGRH